MSEQFSIQFNFYENEWTELPSFSISFKLAPAHQRLSRTHSHAAMPTTYIFRFRMLLSFQFTHTQSQAHARTRT